LIRDEIAIQQLHQPMGGRASVADPGTAPAAGMPRNGPHLKRASSALRVQYVVLSLKNEERYLKVRTCLPCIIPGEFAENAFQRET
jgi:hypothetical protein